MNNRPYTIQEAANVLGVSTKTLRRWDLRGLFVPTRTIGNQRRYTPEQIQEFKKASRVARKQAPIVAIATKMTAKAEPLFSEEPPVAPEPVRSLPSALSGLPSNSFLKQHFILRQQEREMSESKNTVEKREESLNRAQMSKFSPAQIAFMFAGLVLMLSIAGVVAMTNPLPN